MRWLALVALAGCRCGGEAQTRPEAAPRPPRADAAVRAKVAMQPVTLDSIASLLPAPGDVLVPLTLTPDGTQAHLAWCVAAPDAKAAAATIADALDKAGWTGAAARPQTAAATVSADRDGFHLSIVVRGSAAIACAQDKGKVAANATIFHLAPP